MRLRTAFVRLMLACALAVPAALTVSTDSVASVSIAVAFDALVQDADAVAVVNPEGAQSVWEDGRIYTYTKVKVEQGVAGDVGAGADGYIRTLGGVVGKVGQMVDGEPVLVPGKPSLLFLRKFKVGAVYEVSARAQGQYPLVIDGNTKVRRVIRSLNAGLLLPPKTTASGSTTPSSTQTQVKTSSKSVAETEVTKVPRLAQEVIHDRPLDDVAREIATSWRKLHPVASAPAATPVK